MDIEIKNGKVKDLTCEMSFIDRLYLPAILKGLSITIRHFIATAIFRRQYTVEYPEKQFPIFPRFRGKHRLKRDEEGRERCVACLLCMWSCPTGAIFITGEETKREEIGKAYPKEKHSKIWNLDYQRCIFCGFCQEACPEAAIFLEEGYDIIFESRQEFLFKKEQLMEDSGGKVKFRD